MQQPSSFRMVGGGGGGQRRKWSLKERWHGEVAKRVEKAAYSPKSPCFCPRQKVRWAFLHCMGRFFRWTSRTLTAGSPSTNAALKVRSRGRCRELSHCQLRPGSKLRVAGAKKLEKREFHLMIQGKEERRKKLTKTLDDYFLPGIVPWISMPSESG